MRAFNLIVISALIGLWSYFALAVAEADTSAPVALAVPVRADGPTAESLNNEGVRLSRVGRPADALAYFEQAHAFRPLNEEIAANLARQQARVGSRGWLLALGVSTAAAIVLLLGTGVVALVRGAFDRVRLARLRLRGDVWVRVRPGDKKVEMPLRFSERVESILRRHPLTIVWSSSGQGKHMKSRPPVAAKGKKCTVKLDADRLERLRRYPGLWKGFLYIGRTLVGEAAARVG